MTFNFIFKGFGSLVQGVLVPSFLKSAAKLLPFSDPTKFFAQKVLNFQKMYNPFDKILVNSTLHLHFVNSTYHFCVSLPLVIWMEAGLCLYKCGMSSRVLSLPASSPFPIPSPLCLSSFTPDTIRPPSLMRIAVVCFCWLK